MTASATGTRVPAWAALLPRETDGPEETMALGRALAAHLTPGAVVALYGGLGAGKTHLVKGIAAARGVPEEHVVSPTFTILHEYRTPGGPLYHFDAYRIRRPEELYELGYEEYFYGDGICLVEWAERIEPLLPPDALRLRLEHLSESRRRISLTEERREARSESGVREC